MYVLKKKSYIFKRYDLELILQFRSHLYCVLHIKHFENNDLLVHSFRGYEMTKIAVTKQPEKKVGYETTENTGTK